MNSTAIPTIDDIVAALRAGAGELDFDPPAARLFVASLRTLARGKPLTREVLASLAEQVGASEEQIDDLNWVAEKNDKGAIVGLAGLSLNDWNHTIEIGDQRLTTWCALDTLYITLLLKQTTQVETHDPVTSYYLGSHDEGYEDRPMAARLREGLALGLLVTAGFLLVFGTAGIVISVGLRFVVRYLPLGAVVVGIGLVLLGLWLLAGKSLLISLPVPDVDVHIRSPKTVFLFGLAYGAASLSCSLPVFLVVVGTSLTVESVAGGAAMFSGYAAGMGSVLMTVSLGAALCRGTSLIYGPTSIRACPAINRRDRVYAG